MWPPPASEPSPVPTEVWPVPFAASVSSSPRVRPATTSSRGSAAAVRLQFSRRRLGPQSLYFLGAAGQMGVGHGEMRGVGLWVKIAVGQSGPHCQPTWRTREKKNERGL